MRDSFDKYEKLELTIHSVVLAIILIIIAIFFWPNNEEPVQSNDYDESKLQVKVVAKRINIRELPTTESLDIGDVYKDEIYTVLDYVDKDDFYWYKIETNTGIIGYIASDPNDEYAIVINGYIDRVPPEIFIDKEFLTFKNGEVTYDDVLCIDDYSSCTLTHNYSDALFIMFVGKDDSLNISTKKIRYYDVYDTSDIFIEDSRYLNSTYKKNLNNGRVNISASFVLKKDVVSYVKSQNYSPIITFYDSNFNEIKNIDVIYNESSFSDNCINNSDFSLKEEYLDKDLVKGDTLCINYSFLNNQDIKYFAVGFTGVENYNIDENYLANYYSKYYINY